MKIKTGQEKVFADWKEKNSGDAYSARCFSFAEDWAKLMEAGFATGKKLEDIADDCANTADYDGITGFMFGAACSILINCWEHGDELKTWRENEKMKMMKEE